MIFMACPRTFPNTNLTSAVGNMMAMWLSGGSSQTCLWPSVRLLWVTILCSCGFVRGPVLAVLQSGLPWLSRRAHTHTPLCRVLLRWYVQHLVWISISKLKFYSRSANESTYLHCCSKFASENSQKIWLVCLLENTFVCSIKCRDFWDMISGLYSQCVTFL